MKTHFRSIPLSPLRIMYWYDPSIRFWTFVVVDADENIQTQFETEEAVKGKHFDVVMEYMINEVTAAAIAASRERRDQNHQASCLYKTPPYDRRRLVDAVVDAADSIDRSIYWHARVLNAQGPEELAEARQSWSYDIARINHRIANHQGV